METLAGSAPSPAVVAQPQSQIQPSRRQSVYPANILDMNDLNGNNNIIEEENNNEGNNNDDNDNNNNNEGNNNNNEDSPEELQQDQQDNAEDAAGGSGTKRHGKGIAFAVTDTVSSDHPKYPIMIRDAIVVMKQRKGSSGLMIAKTIEAKHKGSLPPNFRKMLTLQLRNLVRSGRLIRSQSRYRCTPFFKKNPEARRTSSTMLRRLAGTSRSRTKKKATKRKIAPRSRARSRPAPRPRPRSRSPPLKNRRKIVKRSSPSKSKKLKTAKVARFPNKKKNVHRRRSNKRSRPSSRASSRRPSSRSSVKKPRTRY